MRVGRVRSASRQTRITVLGSLFFLILLLLTWIFIPFFRHADIQSALNSPAMVPSSQDMHNSTLKKLTQFIQLPPDQDAIVGEIKNVKKLAGYEKYFTKARDGDELIVYPNETIIYDPASNYIVDIAMVNLLDLQPKQ